MSMWDDLKKKAKEATKDLLSTQPEEGNQAEQRNRNVAPQPDRPGSSANSPGTSSNVEGARPNPDAQAGMQPGPSHEGELPPVPGPQATSPCSSCSSELRPEFRFCPYCGHDLQRPRSCPNCQYENEANSRFCQECGTPLAAGAAKPSAEQAATREARSATAELEPPPLSGITIEFPYSTAQSFDFALECARRFPTFRQYGEAKKAVYRVTIQPAEMEQSLELIEHLKGWRRRMVYVDGEKVPWESVFAFTWCYERRRASFKPEYYCLGYENEWEFNLWGCIQARLPFTERADWFCWGRWRNTAGDWEFDKERIRHELQKELYQHRFCPALDLVRVEDVLRALPDQVNPAKDKNWQFIEKWNDADPSPSITVTVTRFGYKERVAMKGVSPVGHGAAREIARKLGLRLPSGK